jgi:hypothetical protein
MAYDAIDDFRYQGEAIWDTYTPMIVQGGSLKTWSFASPITNRVQVVYVFYCPYEVVCANVNVSRLTVCNLLYYSLGTEGRPLDASIDLWQGPDNSKYALKLVRKYS